MSGQDLFYTYLTNELQRNKSILSIISGSKAPDMLKEQEIISETITTLEDIIHHFNLFVKGDNDASIEEG